MKILTIDIGNSNICIGCVNDHRVEFVERMHSDRRKTDLEFAVLVKTVLKLHDAEPESLHGAIIASVVPPLTDLLAQAVRKLTGLTPMILGPGIKTGIRSIRENVGADLVAGAAAAIEYYGAPAIAIDMGTATAFTVIDSEKRFLGGALYPGVALALESLESGTAQLPGIQLTAPKKVIQSDTMAAMQAGVVYGNAGAIDALLDRIEEELGESAAIIANGSLAHLIVPYCRHKITVDDELLLKGLDLIYHKNIR